MNVASIDRVNVFAFYSRVMKKTRCLSVQSRQVDKQLRWLGGHVRQCRCDDRDDCRLKHRVQSIVLDNDCRTDFRSLARYKIDGQEQHVATFNGPGGVRHSDRNHPLLGRPSQRLPPFWK